MTAPILFCGDTHLRNAAAYLAGVLASADLAFDYIPSDRDLTDCDLTITRRLIVLSDYPAARVSPELQQRLVHGTRNGAGLLMIGGWESFHGLGGDWDGTAVGEMLPVEVARTDDRINSDRPLLVRRTRKHALTDGLPWKRRPPSIGGLNRVRPREGAEVLLVADRLQARRKSRRWKFEIEETFPLLVVGQEGRGRTAVLTTDLAPHWVGGMVDWGEGRVAGQAPEADAIEVGDLYARFVLQLIRWTQGD